MKGNNLLAGNNNGNNLPLPLPANLFDNIKGFNLSLNNNNNLLPRGLDPNVTALINALTEINLTEGYYLRERSFIKPTEFGGIKTKDLNE